ncbi:MAG: ABC transporter ATP-binding protein [Cyclobacteriaceae bacterium]|nr:ABC transporter ATP-binding protein [Cyclobacteriaceae bacterium]
MIKIEGLSKRFGNVSALAGVDLMIDTKGVVAVLGPNGSGKTTLIKSILGMVIPSAGDIFFQGKSILGNWDYRKSIDYLPQIARFPDNLTIRELFAMIYDIRGKGAIAEDDELISLFGLKPHLDKKLGNLSGGTRQKVNIILAFSYENPLMVLDEPTAGLDPVSLVHLKDLILKRKEMGNTIVVTTHIMSLVEEIADQIVFLLEGKIYYYGTVEDIKKKAGKDDLERAIAEIIMKADA